MSPMSLRFLTVLSVFATVSIFVWSENARASFGDFVRKFDEYANRDEIAAFGDAFNRDIRAQDYANAGMKVRAALEADPWDRHALMSLWVLCAVSADECARFSGGVSNRKPWLECPRAYDAFMTLQKALVARQNERLSQIGVSLQAPADEAEIWMAAAGLLVGAVLDFRAAPDRKRAAYVVALMNVMECSSDAYSKSDRFNEAAFSTVQKYYPPVFGRVMQAYADGAADEVLGR